MIVKVQISLYTSQPVKQVLIYDESGEVEWDGDATQEILDLMGDRPKAFFHAAINADRKIKLLAEAGDHDW